MKKYIRSERANLFEPNVYIALVVKLSGSISKEEIEHAVNRAYEANETTMSQIVLEGNGNAFYEKRQCSGCRFIIDNRPWQELLGQSERETFALNKGELVRIFLTEENGQMLLFIHAHHLVGDGKSVLILLGDIVKSLNGESLSYKTMLSVDCSFLEKRAKLATGIKMYIQRMNRKWKKNGRNFTWEDYYAIHKKYWSEYLSEIEWKTYEIEDVKRRCLNGVTVNSYFITELLRDYPECSVVGIPVSIRVDGGMSNQTSGIAIKCKYNSKRSFEDNLCRIHKAIHKKIKQWKYFILLFMERLCPSLVDSVLLQTYGCYQNELSEKMAKIMGYLGDGGRDLGITNLNVINIPSEYERFTVEKIMFIPPKVSYAKKVIGVSTYKNTLTMCHHKMRRKEVGAVSVEFII